MYRKNNKGANIDPWGAPNLMILDSKKTVPNETKKALYVRYE